ncbi:TRAP transporter small permease [Rossellomorea vietnamensis]|uniref:TRAP transporter small permease n=1 Tax=Rossellomorea vietnamensis TaxID=218284 RepID=A0ACD4C4T4_9BACI|nr:TRAP transporter small permease [Rossellomorea vietnamensis]UXH43346.1 TRAP transporter small permease [Rossellomorea vietnamensis]
MKQFVFHLSNRMDRFSRWIMIGFFMIAFITTVYQVFSRFVLQSTFLNDALPMVDFSVFNLTWAEELIRYLFVWIVFLGIGIVYKAKGHAQVEILHHYLSEKSKKYLHYFMEVINSALFLFLIFFGGRILQYTKLQISPAMGINMTFIYVTVLVSAVICLIHSVNNIYEVKEGKVVVEDAMKVEEVQQQTNIS